MNQQSRMQAHTSSKASTGLASGILQRKCACGSHTVAGGECGECARKTTSLQRKMRIGASNDPLEREADRVADQVLSNSSHPAVSSAAPRIQRYSGQATQGAGQVPASVERVLGDSGRALETGLSQEMGERFGHDFSQVRVHTGGEAEQSAREVNARAYTVGQHIVFGAGGFQPQSREGRRLLAHELTHVVQQSGNPGTGLIQRAEVDDRSCAGLPDIAPDIESQVNTQIAAARAAAAKPMVLAAFLQDVANRVGGTFVGSIEKLIQGMPTSKRTDPASDLSNTKFSGVQSVNRFYNLHTLGLAKVVGPAANVKGICTGADKFGHFFEEGFLYFKVAQITQAKATAAGTTASAADIETAMDKTGDFLEISAKQGLGVTGVFSNADKAANRAGKQFYDDLAADPNKYKFSVAKYITSDWNETSNPSFYAASEGPIIWANLLTGAWDGKFTNGAGTPVDAKVDLKASAAGTLTGTYEWPTGAAKPNKEVIKNGKITPRTKTLTGTLPTSPPQTNTDTASTGVTIDFDWEFGKTSKGKGKWDSVNEQKLQGTWGFSSSVTNGGTWELKKV